MLFILIFGTKKTRLGAKMCTDGVLTDSSGDVRDKHLEVAQVSLVIDKL